MQDSDVGTSTASATALSAEESEKQRRKLSREKFLDKIRGSLGSVRHQLAFSAPQAAVACGRSSAWVYRQIYAGRLRVLNAEDGRLIIPRSELERYLGGAERYDPKPRFAKKGVEK
jgi:hypothetical protein